MPMTLSQWRSGLTAWLNNQIVIDTWELRNPLVYGTNNGFIAPLQGLTYLDDTQGTAQATQDIYITSLYSEDTLYHQLPLGSIEQEYLMLCRKLSLQYREVADLQELQVIPVEDAIQVTEYGDNLADWLITRVLSLRLTWIPVVTPLPGEIPLNDPPVITSITNGLYNERLISTSHTDPLTRDKFGEVVVTYE